ncbi:oxidoreductase [Phenylobacterium montanum]|nr:NAD(P)-binding protein [Caulobacter sp. S6]
MSDETSRFDILFEPVRIGPVIAPNRFYQVPHCNGMGHRHPLAHAKMREVKAEGGWGVVCTEEVEIHPSSEFSPYIEGRLWDDGDIPALACMTEAVKRHGALAGIELAHTGLSAANLWSREIPLSPSGGPVRDYYPISTRAMDKADIADLRRWHRAAALRAKKAGFDIVYVYAGHDLGLPMHFLSRSLNSRTDEYGGSLENRARLLKELIEDTKDAVGDTCAVAVRLSIDQLLGPEGITAEGEGREVIALLAELPDLWDVCLASWSNDSMTARFAEEGFQEPYAQVVKALTSKPVVGVGRFTSPDAMVSQVRRGVLDLIGAARPSIADPFLPAKIREGRFDAIRECIGCNICVSGDTTLVPIRCTQNPTMGEEWRRGWHPERIPALGRTERVLILGAGPAGLEAARALAQRGCEVVLADAAAEAGGRAAKEARLPGLSTWKRVADHRLQAILPDPKVSLYLESRMEAEDVAGFDCDAVVVATGSTWRRDGMGRAARRGISGLERFALFTPDDVMAGRPPEGPVLVYDDDHYYMAGVLAELLAGRGLAVTYATPASVVSAFTDYTLEQAKIQARLIRLGVQVRCGVALADGRLGCVHGGPAAAVEAPNLLLVTARDPDDALYRALIALPDGRRLERIGDALAPGTIAAAVYSGHRLAREWDMPAEERFSFKRERVSLEGW